MEMELRKANAADEAFLKALFKEIHAPELLPAAIPASMAAQLLDMQYRGQKMSYEAQFPAGESYIIALEGEPIGRLFVHQTPEELRLVDIALRRAWQSRGLGTQLLRELGNRAREQKIPLRLSVRPTSPAARLYTRLGFVEISATQTHAEMEWTPHDSRAEPHARSAGSASLTDTDDPRLEANSAAFRRLIGLDVQAQVAEGAEVTLRVAAVRALVVTQPGVVGNDSFVVVFHGPVDAVIGAATYWLRFGAGDGASSLEVFVSPLGPRGDVMEYEAIFNRMAPAET